MKDDIKEAVVCPAIGLRKVEVCVPVSVKPFAKVGEIRTKCCGEAVITPGTHICEGKPEGTCDFTITQKICIEVPVDFGAEAEAGEAHINCNSSTSENCNDCGEQRIEE